MIDAGLLNSMVGQRCWYVSGGSGTVPSFELVFGEKVPRTKPLANPTQEEVFRLNGGSLELLVWSSWRLQSESDVYASSDQGELGIARIKDLRNKTVTTVSCVPPAWDLRIEFSDGLSLLTFSDHVEPEASIAQNWELYSLDRCLRTGPGAVWESVER